MALIDYIIVKVDDLDASVAFYTTGVGLRERSEQTSARDQVVCNIGRRNMANILVGVFAIFLCLINAVVWTLVSDKPLVSIGWLLAAVACVWLQKWSRG